MAEIAVITFPPDGSQIELEAAAASDTAKCGSNRMLMVNNGSGADVDVTISVPGNTEVGEAEPDNVVTVPAGEMWGIPLLDVYKDPTDRLAHIAYESTTTVTVGVLEI